MALNFPGPYELRFFYTITISSVAIQHVHRLNVNIVGDPVPPVDFASISILGTPGGVVPLDTVVDGYVALLRELTSAVNSFSHVELWKYTPGTFDSEFVSTYALGLAGLNVTAVVAAGQLIHTYRTAEGGILRWTFMESNVAQDVSRGYATMSAREQAISDFILGVNRYFYARDTSLPVAFIASHPGQSEVIFKKRYRS